MSKSKRSKKAGRPQASASLERARQQTPARMRIKSGPSPRRWTRAHFLFGALLVISAVLGFMICLPLIVPDNPPTANETAPAFSTTGSVSEVSLATATAHELEAILNLPATSEFVTNAPAIDIDYWTRSTDQAIETLKSEFPDDAMAEHLFGLVQLRLKRTKSAEPSLRRCVQLSPADPQMRIDLAELLMQTGRDSDALEVLGSRPDALKPTAEYWVLLGDCQQRLNQLNPAADSFQHALKIDANDSAIWLKLSQLQLQALDLTAAESSVRQAISLREDDPAAWRLLARILSIAKRSAEAQQARSRWELLMNSQPSSDPTESFEAKHSDSMSKVFASAFRSIGLVYQSKGRLTSAQSMFQKATEVDPKDALALSVQSALLRKMGDIEQAANFTRRLMRMQPLEKAHYQNLANLAMEQSRPLDAEAALRLACFRFPNDGDSHLTLAKFLMIVNKPDEAIEPAKIAGELGLQSPGAAVLQDALNATRLIAPPIAK